MTKVNKSDKDRVIIFDTTLRDGEQCPGATMTFEEKLEVAEMLDDMGVDVIEAGFPITSEGDFQAVSEIARRSKNAIIAGLAARPSEGHRPLRGSREIRQARPRPYRDRDLAAAYAGQAQHDAGAGDRDLDRQRRPRPQPDRRRRMVGRGRHPQRNGIPVPGRRGRDQGRRHHGEYSRYRRLYGAGGIHPLHAHPDRAGAEFRQGGVLGALP